MIRRYLLQLINQLINWKDFKLTLGFLFIWLVFSYPFFLQGKIPAPLDFLVNFYAPWDAYYDAPIKNSALSDVVSQIIPWKTFNAEELKSGRIPVWNPYNLAGTPHLGNWQSGVFYPTTLLFLFLPITAAWSLHILLQPLLAGIFMILFLRSLHLSRISSLLAAAAFAYGGFMTTWLEWGTLGHAILWLPLAIFSIEKIARIQNSEFRIQNFNLLLILSLTMSWLAGHPQTTIYIVMVTSAYWLYRGWKNSRKIKLLIAILLNCYIVPLLLAAPQVLPAIQVYLNSARTLVDGTSWARAFLIPVSGLVTFLAPDFFGNPVTRNSWSNFSYVEMSGYVGIVTLILVIVAIKEEGSRACRQAGRKKEEGESSFKIGKFLLGIILIGLLLSVDNPISRLLIDLKLPIISSSSPARLMGIIDFSLAVLAALGLDRLVAMIKAGRSKRVFYGSWLAVTLVLAAMWTWAALSASNVAQRNLILPSILTLAAIVSVFVIPALSRNLYRFRGKHGMTLISYLLFLILIFDLFRFHHKFTPYTDVSLWYPQLPVLVELRNRQGRSFGLLDGNLNLPFRIYSLDGYDPMVNAEYAKLTYSGEELAKRSRVTGPYFPKGEPETVDLVSWWGGKWFVDSATPGGESWDLRLWEYGGQFIRVWGDDKYQIFFNREAVSDFIEPVGGIREEQGRLFIIGLIISVTTVLLMFVIKVSDTLKYLILYRFGVENTHV